MLKIRLCLLFAFVFALIFLGGGLIVRTDESLQPEKSGNGEAFPELARGAPIGEQPTPSIGKQTLSSSSSAPSILSESQPKWASLEERMRIDSEGLELVDHPDGRQVALLDGRFLHMSAAVRDREGRLQIQCFTNYEALEGSITGSAPHGFHPHEKAENEVATY